MIHNEAMKYSEDVDKFGIPKLLIEMARIGDMGNYSFWVYTEPLGNPSFHLKFKKDFEIVLQMKDFKILEVKFNNTPMRLEKNEHPPQPIIKMIKKFLAAKNEKDPEFNNERFMTIIWKGLNG
jgi:hypothetical protein